ncbi:PPOX class F420-dependent oxidoreductase [Terrabacter sp. NPDC000476]|uniref:PPOX class F420-dependent oxidoreductase n=1 Tax=Terrabacter sp. NPDC000476 TaxID=3154258 RepID=UPI00331DD911
MSTSDAFAALAREQYVSLTTFRRSGEPVSSAVWIAPDGDELVVITIDPTGKLKRLAHTRRVGLRPCDRRGRVAEGAPTYSGRATVDRSDEAVATVKRAIGRKYRIAAFADTVSGLFSWAVKRKPRAAIRITLS